MDYKQYMHLTTVMGKALKSLLVEIRRKGFSGRCWGVEKGNPFYGSHVDLGSGDEYVTVFVKDGRILVREYRIAQGTALGAKVKKALSENNVPFEN